MSLSKEYLHTAIMEFISILHRCLAETNYSGDRALYRSDIATSARWLVRLHKEHAPQNVAKEIIDPSTTKHFTDYWRHGEWGELQTKALKELQESIRRSMKAE